VTSVEILAAAQRREGGGRADEVWSDLELPDWQEFVGARERFFEGLRRLERPGSAGRGAERPEDAGESPREGD
jgi:hypothetical protein